ncbi:hypothetical protein LTR10_011952 [Elasticomyces elasticus]|nr:hypothetical protein LTR10_011952 [Elasticomyces elasticus]KAK4968893.1 hypothetical protein LTR42_009172 [Elasticomyces elasticus]
MASFGAVTLVHGSQILVGDVGGHMSAEPLFRNDIIYQINRECAARRQHMLIPMRQWLHTGHGHAVMLSHRWSEEEARSTDRAALPIDMARVAEHKHRVVFCWIFDASACAGALPPVDINPASVLKDDIFIFRLGAARNDILLYFDDLDMVRTASNKTSLSVRGLRNIHGQKYSLMRTLAEEVWPSLSKSSMVEQVHEGTGAVDTELEVSLGERDELFEQSVAEETDYGSSFEATQPKVDRG